MVVTTDCDLCDPVEPYCRLNSRQRNGIYSSQGGPQDHCRLANLHVVIHSIVTTSLYVFCTMPLVSDLPCLFQLLSFGWLVHAISLESSSLSYSAHRLATVPKRNILLKRYAWST